MAITLSAAVLFTAAVIVLIRWAGLKVWQALICVLAGFFLAQSQVGPVLGRLIQAAATHLT